MISRQPVFDQSRVSLALETSIYIGLAIALATACYLILRPFIPLLTWGIIIAVAVYPGFRKLCPLVGGREIIGALLCTAGLLALVTVPAVLLAEAVAESVQTVAAHLRNGTAVIPPPPASIESWPLIGAPLTKSWSLASRDLTEVVRTFAPEIKAALPSVLSTSADIGLAVLQILVSILVAGALLAKARAAYEVTCRLMHRLFGAKGPEFQQLIGATIRSVTFGILGVAVIQSALAAVGFLIVRLPGVGLWTVLFLFAAVLQAGALVLIPAVIYEFAAASTTKAVMFLAWCLVVGIMDNVLKPLLLGRGVAVPVIVVFVGAIGGFLLMGIVGLFVGAVVLSVGYKLSLAWLYQDSPAN